MPKKQIKEEINEEVKNEVKELLENEETETRICSKCKKSKDMTAFKNIRSQKDTKTCLKCRDICYKSYKSHNGYGKIDTFTKSKQIEYLCDIMNKEIQQVKLQKYDKLKKFNHFNYINNDVKVINDIDTQNGKIFIDVVTAK